MKRILVRYKVKPDRAEENRAYVQKVFAELHQANPAGLRYITFRSSDGVTHFHLASIETEGGENPLTQLPAFKAFAADVQSRCVEPPVAIDLEEVGSYHFFTA
jgi:quinol monooxygenase YgiN